MMKRLTVVTAMVILALGAAPAIAQHGDHGGDPHAVQAAEGDHGSGAEHGGGHGPKYGLMTIDVMAAVWTIVVFVLLLVLLRTAAWKPIQNALIDREKFIAESLARAKADREAAEARLKEYEAKLEAAGKEAAAIVEEARRDAQALRQRMEEEARSEADRMIGRAKKEIELAMDTAVKELYARSAKLATEIAARVIRKELDAAQHERLIAESIEELQTAGQT